MSTNKQLVDELYEEKQLLKKEIQELKSTLIEKENDMYEIIARLKGVGFTISSFGYMKDWSDEEAYCSAISNLATTVDHIVKDLRK